ncbi:MAG: hypothetical protein LBR38_09085 [Synergistaceae bacterium]|nr:hypothetical protein [Synergistaceae bacterium]
MSRPITPAPASEAVNIQEHALPALLDERQVAALTGFSVPWLRARRYSDHDGPPFVKIGDGRRASVRYPRDLLFQWINTLSAEARP